MSNATIVCTWRATRKGPYGLQTEDYNSTRQMTEAQAQERAQEEHVGQVVKMEKIK